MHLAVLDKSVLFSLAAFFFLLLPAMALAADSDVPRGKKIILVGASVGQEWELSGLPRRTNRSDLSTESIAVYQFDKTEAIDEVLMRPKRKFRLTKSYFTGFLAAAPQPVDTVIIKECAAYFPGDLESYKGLIRTSVKKIRDKKTGVALATVVPVTAEHALKKPGRMESIREFNDWVRKYAKEENIALLDLEAAVRTDAVARNLRPELTSGDGLHLNKKAYDILDRLLISFLATDTGTRP